MKNRLLILFILIQFFGINWIMAQESYTPDILNKATSLFQNTEPLLIKFRFSIKNVKHNTNDSTYLSSMLSYQEDADHWDSIEINLRARGNFRRNICYNVPLKLKLKKSLTKGTVFEGNKKLKLVLPCLSDKKSNDYIVKEYMAYKIYEVVSPYHFKTRLVNIEFEEEKNKKIKKHDLIGILVEDLKNVEDRSGGKEITRKINPFQQDAIASIQLSFFQYLIGNTDFSADHLHNDKLLFIDNKFIGIPYDFDMSGLVNANYAKVSGIENIPTKITHVTQRAYKGYIRDESILQGVREEFIGNKDQILKAVISLKELFTDEKQYEKAIEYVAGFFIILEDDKSFSQNIVTKSRTK